MKKKILAAALAMTMVLGSSTSALATPTTTAAPTDGIYGADVSIDSSVKVPVINISVPTTVKIGINPYEMNYNPEDPTDTSATLNNQIVCADQEITNESDVPIEVNIEELKATPAGDLVLAAAAPAAAVQTKTAFIYFESTTEVDENGKATYPAFKPTNPGVLVVPAATASNASTAKGAKKEKILTIAAGDQTAQKAMFRFAGSVASKPAKAWTAADKATISVKFTFTPLVKEKEVTP